MLSNLQISQFIKKIIIILNHARIKIMKHLQKMKIILRIKKL